MKNRIRFLLFATFLLTSCDIVFSQESTESFSLEESYAESSDENLSSLNLKTIILDSEDFVSYSYDSGNYGRIEDSSISFLFYRAYGMSTSGKLAKFLAPDSSLYVKDPKALSGSLANSMAIVDIRKIEIEYLTVSDARISYGYDNTYDSSLILDKNNKNATICFTKNSTCYFRIEAGDSNLIISSVKISYSGEGDSPERKNLSSGSEGKRLNPEVYSGTLSDGVSVEVPVSVSYQEDSYTVLENKKYTYYSYSYISSHSDEAEKASYTDPMDVANYFSAFGTYPVNYVSKSEYKNATKIFGDKTRCVSEYSRSDGYALSIPYALSSSGKPDYFECDIALDSTYSSSNRGVGRLVVWKNGFSESKGAIGYSSSPIAVYTDDHYSTFLEYYYDGTWSERFNSYYSSSVGLSCATDYIWGSPTTL